MFGGASKLSGPNPQAISQSEHKPRFMSLEKVTHGLLQVWLLEMNANPALHTNCSALKSIIPTVVNETLGKWEAVGGSFEGFFQLGGGWEGNEASGAAGIKAS